MEAQAPHHSWPLATPINGLAWLMPGTTPVCAAAGGNGILYLLRPDIAAPFPITLNTESALLCLTATPHGFLTGNDAGQVHLITPQGEPTLLHTLPGKFIEHIAYSSHAEQALIGAGKTFLTLNLPDGSPHATHTTPSSIGGIAASPIGRRAAVSHYNGASIYDLAAKKNPPRLMEWKGSHLGLTYSPDGKWLISSMQEQSIHLWRLSDGMDLQMRGYPAKITQFAWTHDSVWLATNGGTGVPFWNFSNKEKGPAGQQAKVVADSGNGDLPVTAIAVHPKGPFIAVGFADGLALLANYQTSQTILLHAPDTDKPVEIAHLAWSPDGLLLTMANADGTLTATNFANLA